MSELIETLEKMLEIIEETDYPIDKIVMTETSANKYFKRIRKSIKDLLKEIKNGYTNYRKYAYRRIIVSTDCQLPENDLFQYDGKMWKIVRVSPHDVGDYELFLQIKKTDLVKVLK